MVGSRTTVAITEAGDSIRKMQGLIINGGGSRSLPDTLEELAMLAELHLFAGAFYEEKNEGLHEASKASAKIRAKASEVARLLREIECEADRLHASCLAVQ